MHHSLSVYELRGGKRFRREYPRMTKGCSQMIFTTFESCCIFFTIRDNILLQSSHNCLNNNFKYYNKIKYIDIKYNFIRDIVQVSLKYISSDGGWFFNEVDTKKCLFFPIRKFVMCFSFTCIFIDSKYNFLIFWLMITIFYVY